MQLNLENFYEIHSYDKDGRLKWAEVFPNLITTQGLNDVLTKYLAGVTYTAAWYVGLVDNASFSAFAATDTAAAIGGANGWKEFSSYSGGNRQKLIIGSPLGGVVDNSLNLASFMFPSAGTLKGAFIASSQPAGSTSGILYGEGAFSGGLRTVAPGDTWNFKVSLTAASA